MSKWDDDSYAFSVSSGRSGVENVLSVKMNGISVRMLVDSGVQLTLLGEKQFEILCQRGLGAELIPDNRKLRVYGNSLLPVIGVFHAVITCYGRCVNKELFVIKEDGNVFWGARWQSSCRLLKSVECQKMRSQRNL